jgi:hypothetical protein
VSELIEEHRHELPFSDQLTTMDPPAHRDHRHLVMRQLTPKRLKENEEFVWRLADRQIDEFMGAGRCELISGTPTRSRCSSSPTSSAYPRRNTQEFREALARRPQTARSEAPRTICRTIRWNGSTTASAATSRIAGQPRATTY